MSMLNTFALPDSEIVLVNTDLNGLKNNVHIYELGEGILKASAKTIPIDDIKKKDKELQIATCLAHQALQEFRNKMGFGRAIAAPQVGHSLRFIAINIGTAPMTIYNPEIISTSHETFLMWDDCLSFPNLMCCVSRYMTISVKFHDENGEEIIWRDCAQDISELLQHEIDHLNGVLAVDIAISPTSKDNGYKLCEAVISRSIWLENKIEYNSFVDYSIN